MPKYSGFDPIESHNVVTGSTTISGFEHAITDNTQTEVYLPLDSDTNDDSSNGYTVTRFKGANVSSTQSKFGGSSLELNGTDQWISLPRNPGNNIATTDFTVEMQIYPTTLKNARLWSQWGAGGQRSLLISTTSSGNVIVNGSRDGSTTHLTITSTGTISANTWTHIAVVCISQTVTLYINGVADGSGSIGGNFANVSNIIGIGANVSGVASAHYVGFIDDLRVIKGRGIYTSNFTSPTSAVGLFQHSPVSLYLPFDSDVQDDSSHIHTVTSVASATISSTQAKFGGSSLSLNGTSQYLTIPDNQALHFGSSDFTVEMWVYPTTIQMSGLYSHWNASGSNRSFKITMTGSGNVAVNGSRDGISGGHLSITSSGTLSVNNWYHIAAVCVDGTVTLYIDGVADGSDGIGGTLYNSTNDIAIGANVAGIASNLFAGYIDDVRVTKNAARYTKNFVPPSQAVGATLNGTNETNTTTDFTSLYLPFDSDVNDDSPHGHSVTASGGAAISSTQAKFGGNSLSVIGGTDYLSISDHESFDFGTGDFTVELQIYLPSQSGTNPVLIGAAGGWYLQLKSNDRTLSWYTGSTEVQNTSSQGLSTGEWHHIAICRSGTDLKGFVDGSLRFSTTNSDATNLANTLYIGRYNGASLSFNGYMDDIRILKGHAKYTADFVPPSSAVGTSVSETVNDLTTLYLPFDTTVTTTSVSGDTVLYLPLDSDTDDDSSQSQSVTNSGVTISSTQAKFGSYSGYFDSDYLQVAYDSSLGDDFIQGDFTMEAFIYPTDLSSEKTIFSRWDANSSHRQFVVKLNTSGELYFEFNGNSDTISSGFSVSTNQWSHIAVTRESNTIRLFVNGTLGGIRTSISNPQTVNRYIDIGRRETGSQARYFEGYMDDIRFFKGTALYTSNFDVPTSALGTSPVIESIQGGFEDQARNHGVTKSGTAQLSTSVKKYGTSSLLLDGNSDYLSIPNNGDFQFGDGDFTIEAWVYQTAAAGSDPADRHPIVSRMDGSSNRSFHLGIVESSGAQKLQFSFTSNGSSSTQYEFGGDVTINNWHHVALVREGSTVTCFLNGTALGTTGNIGSSSIFVGTSDLTIGFRGLSSQYFQGYIDDLRIIKGKAKYTANFTAPTSALGSEVSDIVSTATTETKTLSSTWTMTNDGSSPRSFVDMRLDNTWANNEHLQSSPDHRWNSAPGDPGTTATGGSIATPGNGYRYHVFTSPGTFQLSAIDGGSPSLAVEYLVVAGGGGGAANRGGGGGAGGFRTNEDGNPKAGAAMNIATGSFPIVVGTGGAGGVWPSPAAYGDEGGASSFNGIESTGGGGGGGPPGQPGFVGTGGSGGGAFSASGAVGFAGNTPPTTPPQGNPGGNGAHANYAGGGGGASAAASTLNAGNGHAAPSFSGPILAPVIPGAMATAIGPTGIYAGGGGGGAGEGTPSGAGNAGTGGGGAGGARSIPPGSYNPNSGEYGPAGAPGVDNTGGGGGGAGNFPGTNPNMRPGGDGGNGVVIIKYTY